MNNIPAEAILARYGLATKKSLGQNFLTDSAVLQKIADAAAAESAILEIGAGIGSLTNLLCQRARRVVTVELDQGLAPLLKQEVPADHHTFLWQDILQTDFLELKNGFFSGASYGVVGNLPYYITREILMKLIHSAPCWNQAILMVQREVADRLVCGPGSKEYRAITVIAQAFCRVEKLFSVPPHCFFPPPHVHSAVLRLTPKAQLPENPAGFIRFVESVFAARRKMLVSSLPVQQALHCSKEQLCELLCSCGLSETVRGEMFSADSFIHVYNFAQKHDNNSFKL